MRTIRVRIRKGRIVESLDSGEIPEEVEAFLTVPTEGTAAAARRQVLEETNRAYAALRADPKAWQDELRERALWEHTLADGLDAGEQGA